MLDCKTRDEERLEEINKIIEINIGIIRYHQKNGNKEQEFFYRGYNAALRKERNRYIVKGED